MWMEPGKRPPQGAGLQSVQNRSVRLKTKNEPVVGRNIYLRAGPCNGAKQTLKCYTKVVTGVANEI